MIYVVDDDDSICKAMKRLLLAAGLEVETYASAENILANVTFKPDDCLLVDVHLAGMSGIDLKRTLNQRNINTPVIFITAYDTEKNREESRQVGAEGYFRKPIDDQALLDTIKFVVGKKT